MNDDHNALTRDDDVRRLVVGLDHVVTGLADLQAEPALDNHPAIQHNLHGYTSIVKRAADFLAELREGQHR